MLLSADAAERTRDVVGQIECLPQNPKPRRRRGAEGNQPGSFTARVTAAADSNGNYPAVMSQLGVTSQGPPPTFAYKDFGAVLVRPANGESLVIGTNYRVKPAGNVAGTPLFEEASSAGTSLTVEDDSGHVVGNTQILEMGTGTVSQIAPGHARYVQQPQVFGNFTGAWYPIGGQAVGTGAFGALSSLSFVTNLLTPLDTDGFFPSGAGTSSTYLQLPNVDYLTQTAQYVSFWEVLVNFTWGNWGSAPPGTSGELYAEIYVSGLAYPIVGAQKLFVQKPEGIYRNGVNHQVYAKFPTAPPFTTYKVGVNVYNSTGQTLNLGGPDFNGGYAYIAINPIGLR